MIPNANVKVLADVFETLQRENRQRNGHNSGFPADFADEPLSLFRDVPAGDAFPVDALGPVLAAWRARFTKVPCNRPWQSAERLFFPQRASRPKGTASLSFLMLAVTLSLFRCSSSQ